jgi:hypothetical protein
MKNLFSTYFYILSIGQQLAYFSKLVPKFQLPFKQIDGFDVQTYFPIKI